MEGGRGRPRGPGTRGAPAALLHRGAAGHPRPGGFVHDPDGIDAEKLEWLKDLKEVRRGRISEYAEHFGCDYHEGQRPWSVPCELALPCATQNEVSADEETLAILTAISHSAFAGVLSVSHARTSTARRLVPAESEVNRTSPPPSIEGRVPSASSGPFAWVRTES